MFCMQYVCMQGQYSQIYKNVLCCLYVAAQLRKLYKRESQGNPDGMALVQTEHSQYRAACFLLVLRALTHHTKSIDTLYQEH